MPQAWPEHWLNKGPRLGPNEKYCCLVKDCPARFPPGASRKDFHNHMVSRSDYDHILATRIMQQTRCLHDGCEYRLASDNQQAALFLHDSTQHDGCECMSSLPDFVQLTRKKRKRGAYPPLVQEEVALRMAQKVDVLIRQGKPEVWDDMMEAARFGLPKWKLAERTDPPNRKYYEAVHDVLSHTAPIAAEKGGPGPLIETTDEDSFTTLQKWREYTPAPLEDVFVNCWMDGCIDTKGEAMELRVLYANGEI